VQETTIVAVVGPLPLLVFFICTDDKKKSHDKFAPKILHIPENIPYQTKEPTNRMKSGIE